MINDHMARAQRSFNRAQAHYENDSGYATGVKEFTCSFCGYRFDVRWAREYGCCEYIQEPYCPKCGWDNHPEDGPQYTKCEFEDLPSPCPVCGETVHPMGYAGKNDELLHLSCGHWIVFFGDINWEEYCSTVLMANDPAEEQRLRESCYKGLDGRDGFKEFVRMTHKAGEVEAEYE